MYNSIWELNNILTININYILSWQIEANQYGDEKMKQQKKNYT